MNLHEAGLRRSPRLIEKAQREKAKQAKAHVKFCSKLASFVTLFTVLSTVCNVLPFLPARQLPPNASFPARMINCFNEHNALWDGTLNQMHHWALSTLNL